MRWHTGLLTQMLSSPLLATASIPSLHVLLRPLRLPTAALESTTFAEEPVLFTPEVLPVFGLGVPTVSRQRTMLGFVTRLDVAGVATSFRAVVLL